MTHQPVGLVVVVAGLVIGSLLNIATPTTAAAQQTAVTAQAPAAPPHSADAVAMIDLVDVSKSLSKAIKAMSDAEIQQLAVTLKPDDIYARVNFDGTARVAVLMPVRERADVDRITTVLTQNVSATGAYTSISSGLTTARDVVEKERGRRRVVLAVLTDGILSTADGEAAERKRLDGIAGWWRAQPWARRIVVAVGTDKTGAAARLANALDAELVSLDDYAKRSIVARAITSARGPAAAAPTTSTPVVATPPLARWLWLLGAATLALGFGYWRIQRRPSSKAVAPAMPPLPIAGIGAAPEGQVTVRVIAAGRAVDTVVNVSELENGVLTLGTGGTVPVSGLQGRVVSMEIMSQSMAMTVKPGANVRLNGESVDAVPQPIDVGRSCQLTCGGVVIALRLHPHGAESRPPAAMAGLRRRIG